jgi:hypothetical protein
LAAWCYTHRKVNGWLADREKDVAETARLAHRAAGWAGMTRSLCAAGISSCLYCQAIGDGAALIAKALVLNQIWHGRGPSALG